MRGWLAAALVLFAASVSAQPLPDGQKVTLGAVNQVGISNTVNDTTILVQVQGSWTGTITFEGSLDGATYTTLNCTPINGTTAVTTTTGNGIWSCNVIGINFAQARMSAFTAGTATVSFMSAYVSGGGGGASSGSSGTVTINDPSVTSQKAAVNASGQLSVVCANCSGSGVSVLEDVPAVSGDAGTPAYAVRSDTLAGSTSASGDWTWLKSDALGALWTNPYSTTPSAITYLVTRQTDGTNFLTPSVDYTQDGALTVATTAGPMHMCRASSAAPTNVSANDDAVMVWCLQSGAMVGQPTFGGVLATTGNGVSGTGVQRVTLASDSTGTVTVTQGTGTNLHIVCDSGCGGGTQYTQDAALTVGSTVGTMAAGRASAAAPTDVSADNDAVIPWYLRSGAQVHQPTFAGVLAVAGNGVTLASDSTGQVTLAAGANTIGALTANQTVNNAQVSGTAISVGNGASGTGVQRVTIASDSTGQVAITGTAATSEVAPSTILNGQTNVTTAGTRVVLAGSTTAKGVTICAKTTNTGNIFVGSSTVTSANGRILTPGECQSLAIANLNTVNLDSAVNGEGVSYVGVN
jgi:hypothetical protein